MLSAQGAGPQEAGPTQILDRYQIDGCIGRGGMAEVYHGRLLRMGGFEREVAVKVLLPQLSGEPEFVNMLLDEARIAATISHPNVVQVLDVGQAGQVFYLVMEFVDGTDLRSVQRRHDRGRVPEEPLLYIIAEVLRGLYAIHQAKDQNGHPRLIVHRDVTPSNVLITKGGAVKLADFGIAHATGRLTQTRHGAVKGKTRYMAPEQLDGRPIDHRTDLFAVGVVLLEAVLGRDAADVWHATAMGPIFKIPLRLPPGVPPDIARVLERALHQHPSERYQDGAEFRRDVLRVLSERRRTVLPYGADDLELFIGDLLSKAEQPLQPGESRRPPVVEEPSSSLSPLPKGPGTASILSLALSSQTPGAQSPPIQPSSQTGPLPEMTTLPVPVPAPSSQSVSDLPTATVAPPRPMSQPYPPPIYDQGPGADLDRLDAMPTVRVGELRASAILPPALLSGTAPFPAAPTVTLPVLSVLAGENTTPIGPTPLAPSSSTPLVTLADDIQPETVITSSLHGAISAQVAATSAQPYIGEGEFRRTDPSMRYDHPSAIIDLRPKGVFSQTYQAAAQSTLVNTLRQTILRTTGRDLGVKLILMVLSGLFLGLFGIVLLYLLRDPKGTTGVEAIELSRPAEVGSQAPLPVDAAASPAKEALPLPKEASQPDLRPPDKGKPSQKRPR